MVGLSSSIDGMEKALWFIITSLIAVIVWLLKEGFAYFKREWEERKKTEEEVTGELKADIANIRGEVKHLSESLDKSISIWVEMTRQEIAPLKEKISVLDSRHSSLEKRVDKLEDKN